MRKNIIRALRHLRSTLSFHHLSPQTGLRPLEPLATKLLSLSPPVLSFLFLPVNQRSPPHIPDCRLSNDLSSKTCKVQAEHPQLPSLRRLMEVNNLKVQPSFCHALCGRFSLFLLPYSDL